MIYASRKHMIKKTYLIYKFYTLHDGKNKGRRLRSILFIRVMGRRKDGR